MSAELRSGVHVDGPGGAVVAVEADLHACELMAVGDHPEGVVYHHGFVDGQEIVVVLRDDLDNLGGEARGVPRIRLLLLELLVHPSAGHLAGLHLGAPLPYGPGELYGGSGSGLHPVGRGESAGRLGWCGLRRRFGRCLDGFLRGSVPHRCHRCHVEVLEGLLASELHDLV